MHVQIRKDVLDAANEAAGRKDMNLSTWVRLAISEKLERDGAQ